jgi:trimethylamine--corrinoid protein Co-methyltransferase
MNKRFELHVSSLALPEFNLLSSKECEMIHHASLEVLRRTGLRLHCKEAVVLLRDAGATISDENLVRFPPEMVEWALEQVPSSITLCPRGSDEPALRLTDGNVYFGPGSDCPNYLDPRTGETRKFTVADVIDCIHVVDRLPQLGFVMSMGIPSDLGKANVYRHQFALMLEHTSKPIVFVCDDRADCEAIVNMASAVAGGIEKLRLNPNLLLYSEPTSPLQHNKTATEKLLYMAEQSLPIVHSPAPMMGGTAPVTLAGGLVLGNAEVLSSLVMHQLKNPGAPFMYGTGLHHMDMKTTISVYGAPEFQLARVAVAQLGRFYGLPTWGYAGHSDSKIMDEQATADAVFSVMTAFLAGANLAHDVGYLEAGMTTSPEMIVFTAEVIEMLGHFMAGISLDSESLALEVIHRVGPGGHYLTDDHTLRYFRELWQPTLFDRQRLDDWVRTGSKRLGDRLRERTVAIMEEHRPALLPEEVKAEIAYILSQK